MRRRCGLDVVTSGLIHAAPVDWDRVRRQGGVFSRTQARAWGLSDRQIDRGLAAGEYVQAFGSRPGILMAAGTPWSHLSATWAALLSVGSPCALMGITAAANYRWCDPDDVVWVAVPRHRSVKSQPGVSVRRLQLSARDVVTRNDMPLTAPPRTLADCLRFLPRHQASTILDRSQQRGGVDLTAVARLLTPRGRGTRQARMLLAAADGTAFAAERLLAAMMRDAGLEGWTPNFRLRLGERIAVIDFAFVQQKVAIEVDGFAYHSDVERFKDDRSRQNALVNAGWVVLRFTWHDLVSEPERVIDEIRLALANSPHWR
ncbi:MAG TPA: DUF559 domain-containing protein [Actinomycetes bacterium]|nr:DUF559 domain-containing protein [Actinomycetes bacterium]